MANAQIPLSSDAGNLTSDRRAWDDAFAAFEIAQAEERSFSIEFAKLDDQLAAEAAAVPHIVVGPDPYTPEGEPVGTGNTFYLSLARRRMELIEAGKIEVATEGVLKNYHDLLCNLVKADAQRTLAVKAIRQRLDFDTAQSRWDDLANCACDARWFLMDMPAPDISALRWKIEYLLEDKGDGCGSSWTNDALSQTRTDIARLMV